MKLRTWGLRLLCVAGVAASLLLASASTATAQGKKGSPADIEKRIDKLVKELEELRRQVSASQQATPAKKSAKGKETERPSTGKDATPAKKSAQGKETQRPSTGKDATPAKKSAKGKEAERPSTGKSETTKKAKGSGQSGQQGQNPQTGSSSTRPNVVEIDLNRLPPDLADRLLRELKKSKSKSKSKGDRD